MESGNMDLDKTFSGNLRVYRAMAHLTRAQLAEKAGLRTHTIIRMECEQGFIRITNTEKLAEALGVSAYRLFMPLCDSQLQTGSDQSSANLLTTFSNNLKIYRMIRNLTQRGLAQKSGVSFKTVSELENRLDYVKFVTIEKLADALEIQPCRLFKAIIT